MGRDEREWRIGGLLPERVGCQGWERVGGGEVRTALEGLHLAHFVVLLDVLLPEVGAVLGIVPVLVEELDALSGEDLRLEVVLRLERLEERERLVEEVEGVNDHDLGLAILAEVAEAAEQVGDHAVARDHRVREDSLVEVLARRLEGEHGLLLKILEAHLLGLGDEGLLIEGHAHVRARRRGDEHVGRVAHGGVGSEHCRRGGVEMCCDAGKASQQILLARTTTTTTPDFDERLWASLLVDVCHSTRPVARLPEIWERSCGRLRVSCFAFMLLSLLSVAGWVPLPAIARPGAIRHFKQSPELFPGPCQVSEATATMPLPRSPPPLMATATTPPPWRGQLVPAKDCTTPRACVVTQGRIPEALRGTLFRIGAGDASPYDHWFDGDGWVCSLTLRGPDEAPLFRARYVETARRKAQGRWASPGRATRGAWTQRADGSVGENIARLPTNPANTNLLLRDGRLLALCEGGPPVVLDPLTLETLDDADAYGVASFFAAHPRVDPISGDLIGCGLALGAMSLDNLFPSFPAPLNFFEWTRGAARPGRQRAHTLPFFTFVHDLAITPTRAIVVLPPYVIPDLQTYASAVLGQRAVGMCFEWKPTLGTQVMIIDRRTLELEAIVRLPDPPPTCYHVINAFEETVGSAAAGSLEGLGHTGAEHGDDVLALQICEQNNGNRTQLEAQYMDIEEAAFTSELQCSAVEYRIRLPPRRAGGDPNPAAKCVGRVPLAAGTARPFELPDVHPKYIGRRAKYAYVWCLGEEDSTFADALQRIELTEGGSASEVVTFGAGKACGSPLFVPRGDAEDDGYVLTFVFDAARQTSDLVILDAADIAGEPVATVALGQHVPPLFHGIWEEESSPGWCGVGVS